MRKCIKDKGAVYPVLYDADARIAGSIGLRGVPTSVIVDAEGEIRFVEVGYTSETGLRTRLWWVNS